ncbi:hypothetical protein M9H77_33595 [Catharanthus roseus]|uniref:Uncharacterized protein n=1 Tax=Catharanthus roseus TaxID=4058 RepID=A0ACB9ZMD1_CATRO|nr:hypothetical protein M9H77_33595 [Catharanthus roseus]
MGKRMMTSILQEVDDMTSVAIFISSQIVTIMKKVQTIIRRCMVSIGGTLRCTSSQHDIQATFPVQPSRRRVLGDILAGEQVLDALLYLLLHKGRNMSTPAQQWLKGWIRDVADASGTHSGFTAFQSPHPSAYRFGRFRAPPPPGTAGASMPHQPYRRHLRLTKMRGRMLSAAGIVLGRKPSDSRHPTGLSCTDIIFYFSLTM